MQEEVKNGNESKRGKMNCRRKVIQIRSRGRGGTVKGDKRRKREVRLGGRHRGIIIIIVTLLVVVKEKY